MPVWEWENMSKQTSVCLVKLAHLACIPEIIKCIGDGGMVVTNDKKLYNWMVIIETMVWLTEIILISGDKT